MQTTPAPPCPKCGGTAAKLLTESAKHAVTDPYRQLPPVETVLVFKCACGAAFTHTVKHEADGRQAAS